jgi:hypothetical protein
LACKVWGIEFLYGVRKIRVKIDRGAGEAKPAS